MTNTMTNSTPATIRTISVVFISTPPSVLEDVCNGLVAKWTHAPIRISMNAQLLDPCAATLDEDDQHDDKQHSGNNPDDFRGAHFQLSFL
jgi:hypothetical protein